MGKLVAKMERIRGKAWVQQEVCQMVGAQVQDPEQKQKVKKEGTCTRAREARGKRRKEKLQREEIEAAPGNLQEGIRPAAEARPEATQRLIERRKEARKANREKKKEEKAQQAADSRRATAAEAQQEEDSRWAPG